MGIFSRFKGVAKLSKTQTDIADEFFNRGDYKVAFDMYKQAAELGESDRAAFNLGIMYATGKGVEHDYLMAGRYFRMAYTLGAPDVSRYFVKVFMDYAQEQLNAKVYGSDLFAKLSEYVELVWPDEGLKKTDSLIKELAVFYINDKKWYDKAFQLLWAAGRFGNCPECQDILGVCFNNAIGVEQDDRVAAYWYQRAVQNGSKENKGDAEKIRDWYRTHFSKEDTKDVFAFVWQCCANGSQYIPKDPIGEKFWKEQVDSVQ